MGKINITLLAAVITCAAFAGGSVLGYKRGVADTEARFAIAAAERQRELNEAEARRQELEAERNTLAQELEDQANAQPVTSHQCFPVERVRRLNLR